MRREDLDRALGQTPQSFSDRMDQTLLSLKEEEKVKRFAFRTVMVFALITVLLCTTACALVSQGLDWYYNNRFSNYQKAEPEKYSAIMKNLQTEVPQQPVEDPEINISVNEISWAPEQNVLVVSVIATAANPEAFELHPMWDLDADGSYVGKENLELYADDEEARGEHWLWTKKGYGPVAEMVAPGKQLLLLEAERLYLGDIPLTGDGSSFDSYVMDDGSIHAVLEINLQCFFDPAYPDDVRKMIEKTPDMADYWNNRLAEIERFQKIISEDEDGVITLTLPYTVTAYTEDDQQLYTGGRNGEIHFDLKIR